MPIKTGRVRRNYDSALQSKIICSNMLFMALAYLNNQLNYNASLSNAAIAKYENQRSIIAKCALSNGITKAQIREKTISISDTRYPSDKQVQQLADIVNGEDYSFNVSFIPDSDLMYKSEEEIKTIKGQALIQRKDIAIQEEKDFINLCEYFENEMTKKLLHCNLSEDMKMRLRKIRTAEYDYKVILQAAKWYKEDIERSVANKKAKEQCADKFTLFTYIVGIIKRKLPDTLDRIKRNEQEEMTFWEDNVRSIIDGEDTLESVIYLQCEKYKGTKYYGKNEFVKSKLLEAMERLTQANTIKNKLPDTAYYRKRRKEKEEKIANIDMSVATHKGAEYQRKTRKAPRGTDDLW